MFPGRGGYRGGMTSDIEVRVSDPYPKQALSAQDLTELGSVLTTAGLDRDSVRGVVAELQEDALQLALQNMPKILSKVQDIHMKRVQETLLRIRLLPIRMGYVSRDAVVAIVQQVMTSPPRT